jgi:hypothetical protein
MDWKIVILSEAKNLCIDLSKQIQRSFALLRMTVSEVAVYIKNETAQPAVSVSGNDVSRWTTASLFRLRRTR